MELDINEDCKSAGNLHRSLKISDERCNELGKFLHDYIDSLENECQQQQEGRCTSIILRDLVSACETLNEALFITMQYIVWAEERIKPKINVTILKDINDLFR